MPDNIEFLGPRRADKSGDCRDWSVVDALREALQMIESGELKPDMVYVALSSPAPGNEREFVYKAAGGKRLELIGLLYEHLQQRASRS